MIKLIITGVWVAIVTLGAVYFSIQMAKPVDPAAEEAKKKAVQELVKGEVITFPVISSGAVQGYFLTKTSFITDKTKLAEITLPIPEILTDVMYTELVGDKVIRIQENRNFDLKAFRDRVKEAVNKKLGSDVIIDIVVEQIDYLSKEDIKASMNGRPVTIKSGEKIIADKPPEEQDAATEETAPAH